MADLLSIYEDVAALKAAVEELQIVTGNMQTWMVGLQESTSVKLIESGTDLFDLEVGEYLIPDSTVSATLLNKPIESSATARVSVVAGGVAGQKSIYYIPCTKDRATYYQCAYYQGEWGDWNTIDNFDSGWLDLELSTGITAYSEAQKPRYRRIGKEVFLSGVLVGITESDSNIATLPVGYRPSKKVILPVAAIGQKINRMEILVDGTVRYNRSTVEPTIAENWHSIACSFSVD